MWLELKGANLYCAADTCEDNSSAVKTWKHAIDGTCVECEDCQIAGPIDKAFNVRNTCIKEKIRCDDRQRIHTKGCGGCTTCPDYMRAQPFEGKPNMMCGHNQCDDKNDFVKTFYINIDGLCRQCPNGQVAAPPNL
jgi:hypothetical protein